MAKQEIAPIIGAALENILIKAITEWPLFYKGNFLNFTG